MLNWSEMVVTFVEYFNIKVDGLSLSLLHLCPLGLSCSWYNHHHHHCLKNLFPLVLQINRLPLHGKQWCIWVTLRWLITTILFWQSRSLMQAGVSDTVSHSIDENWMWAINSCHCSFFELPQTSTMWGLYPFLIPNSVDSRICVFKWWCKIDTLYVGLVVINGVVWCRQSFCIVFCLQEVIHLMVQWHFFPMPFPDDW